MSMNYKNIFPGLFYNIRYIVTYEWVQKTRVFHYTPMQRFVRDKHSSLLDLHISFNEKKVVNMAPYIMSMCYKLFIQGLY